MSVMKKLRAEIPPELLEPISDINYYTFMPVPIKEHERSRYIHFLMFLLEERLEKKEKLEQQQIRAIAAHLNTFVLTGKNREKMAPEHRKFIWVLRCILNSMDYYAADGREREERKGLVESFVVMDDLKFIQSDSEFYPYIYDYSVLELWVALLSLTKRFRKIVYFDELERYVNALFLSCSKFMVYECDDDTMFDHGLFKKEEKVVGELFYTVNDSFIVETERMFFYMQKLIEIRKAINLSVQQAPFPIYPVNILDFIDILNKKIEFSSKTVEKRIYKELPEWNLIVGEKERFMEEDRLSEPSGYNIVSMYRPETLGEITKIFDQNVFNLYYNGCKTLLDNIKKDPRTRLLFDVNFEMLSMEIASFTHDNMICCKKTFENFIVFDTNLLFPLPQNAFYNADHPSIVQCIGTWFVWSPKEKKMYKATTFVECYLMWMVELREYRRGNLLIQTIFEEGMEELNEMIFGEKNPPDEFIHLLPNRYK